MAQDFIEQLRLITELHTPNKEFQTPVGQPVTERVVENVGDAATKDSSGSTAGSLLRADEAAVAETRERYLSPSPVNVGMEEPLVKAEGCTTPPNRWAKGALAKARKEKKKVLQNPVSKHKNQASPQCSPGSQFDLSSIFDESDEIDEIGAPPGIMCVNINTPGNSAQNS